MDEIRDFYEQTTQIQIFLLQTEGTWVTEERTKQTGEQMHKFNIFNELEYCLILLILLFFIHSSRWIFRWIFLLFSIGFTVTSILCGASFFHRWFIEKWLELRFILKHANVMLAIIHLTLLWLIEFLRQVVCTIINEPESRVRTPPKKKQSQSSKLFKLLAILLINVNESKFQTKMCVCFFLFLPMVFAGDFFIYTSSVWIHWIGNVCFVVVFIFSIFVVGCFFCFSFGKRRIIL